MRNTILAVRGLMAAAAATIVGAGRSFWGRPRPTRRPPSRRTRRRASSSSAPARPAGLVGVRQPLRERRLHQLRAGRPRRQPEARRVSRAEGHLVRRPGELVGQDRRQAGQDHRHRDKIGKRTHVHEELDDAGNHVVSDGWHRRLENDLMLRYAGKTVGLTCGPAFSYRLEVTKTPTV